MHRQHQTTGSGACLWLLAGLSACGGSGGISTASFGEERAVAAAQRPIAFGRGQRERLGLQDVGPASMPGGVRYTATVPKHWQVAPDAQYRDLRWFVDGDPNAECYLTAQVGGGLRDNITRWYAQQFGLPVPSVAEIAAMPTHPLLGEPAMLLELQGTFRGRADTKMLLLVRHQGGQLQSTFRMSAPAAIADREREAFLAVAASVSGVVGGTGDPGGAPVTSDPGAAGQADAAAPFKATIAAGWMAMGDTGSRMLRHRFGTRGEVYVGELGGAVTDMLGIWCSEMGEKPLDAAAVAALPKIPMLGGEAVLLDLQGAHRGTSGSSLDGARLLVAVRRDGQGVVFAKCVGPADDVAAQRAAFLEFCASLERVGR